IFFRSLVSSLPSTMIRPFWCSSRRFMQRIMVDLPDPDGPQITMRSPFITFRLMSRSTWNSPYHLCMLMISIAASVSETASLPGCEALRELAAATMVFPLKLAAVAGFEPAFHEDRIAGHAETEYPVHKGREYKTRCRRGRRYPVWIGKAAPYRPEQVREPDYVNEARILEHADERIHDARNHKLQRLRHHDKAHHRPIADTERLRALILSLGDRLQSTADHLGHIGG